MQLISVKNVVQEGDGSYSCTIVVKTATGTEEMSFVCRPGDPYGLGPEVWRRIAAGEIEGRVYRPN